MKFRSFAQNFEDVLLWRALGDIERGTYIDIGAQDPVHDSVSMAFYERGWRGIHVEPTPRYAAQIRAARPDERVIEAAVTDAVGPIEFFEIADTGLSTGVATIAERHGEAGYASSTLTVPCVRLDRLLDLEPEFHWMKIDVEGMEEDVLRSWGESKVRPWILVIESTCPMTQTPSHKSWLGEVIKRGYRNVHFDGLSRFFVHESHSDRSSAFATPPNVFDGFTVTVSHFTAQTFRTELEEAEQKFRKQEAANSELRIRLSKLEAYLEEGAAKEKRLRERVNIAKEQEAEARELARELVKSAADSAAQFQKILAERLASEDQLRQRANQEQERCRTELEDLRHKLTRAEKHARTLREALAGAERKQSELHSRLGQAQINLAAKEAQFSAKVAELEHSVGEHLRESVAAEQRSAQFKKELDALGEELKFTRTTFGQTEASLRDENNTLRNDISVLRTLLAQGYTPKTSFFSTRRNRSRFVLDSPMSIHLKQWLTTQARTIEPSHCLQASLNENFMQDHGHSRKRNPYLRADSLAELLSWDDVHFVRCAYVTVLGRQPDPTGEIYYAERIRSGRSKMEVLLQLRQSEEGQRHDPGIRGFDRALKRAYFARRPVLGWFLRRFEGAEGDSTIERRMRAQANVQAVRLGELCQRVADIDVRVERQANEIANLEHLSRGSDPAIRSSENKPKTPLPSLAGALQDDVANVEKGASSSTFVLSEGEARIFALLQSNPYNNEV